MEFDLNNKELIEALNKVNNTFDKIYHPEKLDKEYIKKIKQVASA